MRVAVFSDLDGTLLDHSNYSYAPALPAIRALKNAGVPLVLASSKTGAEIAELHHELNLGDSPAIVENGAGVYWPSSSAETGDQAYRDIRSALNTLPDTLRQLFLGFGDLGVDGIIKATGLPHAAAELAAQRCYTEPGQWTGTAEQEDAFVAALEPLGITARRGGRFLTLSFGRTKAQAMAEIAKTLNANVTIALGDAPNDIEMLNTADHGVIIRNDHGTPLPRLPGEDGGRVIRTDLPGPSGWNAAMLHLINSLGLTQELNSDG